MLLYVLFWCWSCVSVVHLSSGGIDAEMLRGVSAVQLSCSDVSVVSEEEINSLVFAGASPKWKEQRIWMLVTSWWHGVSCLCGVTMRDRSEQVRTYHFSTVSSINRLAFVPTDMFLKWNKTRWGDKDLKSLCESNLKVPLRRLLLCSLMSGGAAGRPGLDSGRDGDTDRSCQGTSPPHLRF